MGLAFPKPSKGARLRTKQQAVRQSEKVRQVVYRFVNVRDKYRCRACGKAADPRAVGELQRGHHHHIQFRSQGGADTTKNVALLCALCHSDVHDRTLFITGNADATLTIRRA